MWFIQVRGGLLFFTVLQQNTTPNSSMPDQQQALNIQAIREMDAGKLVRDHIGWMLALAHRMLGDYALAEDTVQDAFISIFRALDSFEGRSSLKTWLHRITVNAALMKLRRLKRLAEQPIDELLPEFDQYECRIESNWKTLESAEKIVSDEQRREQIHRTINQLPDAYRIILLLRDIEGYDTGEVAVLLAISEANVKIRLHRARAALKKLLEPLLRGEAF